MVVHGGKLQNKQAFLFRLVDVANELFAMASSVSRAQALAEEGHPEAAKAAEIADLFCRGSRRTIGRLFHELWHNDDVLKYKVAQKILDGEHLWLEEETMEAVGPQEAIRPPRAEVAAMADPGHPEPVGSN